MRSQKLLVFMSSVALLIGLFLLVVYIFEPGRATRTELAAIADSASYAIRQAETANATLGSKANRVDLASYPSWKNFFNEIYGGSAPKVTHVDISFSEDYSAISEIDSTTEAGLWTIPVPLTVYLKYQQDIANVLHVGWADENGHHTLYITYPEFQNFLKGDWKNYVVLPSEEEQTEAPVATESAPATAKKRPAVPKIF